MREKYCKECNQYVCDDEFYHQGRVCKECRNKKRSYEIEILTGIKLAEYLLHRSCIRAIERSGNTEKEAYKGVRCDWEKPLKMKKDLMGNKNFWDKWIELSKIYEENGKPLNLRPSIDRIESDVEKGGHYTMDNIQVISYSQNVIKAKSKNCKVIFIKGLRIVRITDYETSKNAMKDLGIKGYNVLNLMKNSGEICDIGNGYSVLVQSIDGELKKQDSLLYKGVYTNQQILVDLDTGKEYIISSNQLSFDSYGIWINDGAYVGNY